MQRFIPSIYPKWGRRIKEKIILHNLEDVLYLPQLLILLEEISKRGLKKII